jgi:hypothetical protein
MLFIIQQEHATKTYDPVYLNDRQARFNGHCEKNKMQSTAASIKVLSDGSSMDMKVTSYHTKHVCK